MKQLRAFGIVTDNYSRSDLEKIICPHCGSIVTKNNYCERCECLIGDG
jgi:hypothetical protein